MGADQCQWNKTSLPALFLCVVFGIFWSSLVWPPGRKAVIAQNQTKCNNRRQRPSLTPPCLAQNRGSFRFTHTSPLSSPPSGNRKVLLRLPNCPSTKESFLGKLTLAIAKMTDYARARARASETERQTETEKKTDRQGQRHTESDGILDWVPKMMVRSMVSYQHRPEIQRSDWESRSKSPQHATAAGVSLTWLGHQKAPFPSTFSHLTLF